MSKVSEYIDKFVGFLDRLYYKMEKQDTCPECGTITNREVSREGEGWRTKVSYSCGECGWEK